MSKSVVLMIGFVVGLTLFFSSCGGDDMEEFPSIDIPLAFLSPMAAGDYTVKITITAADIANPIIKEENLAIVEGLNQTYEVTVNNVPVGNRREVKVEVFKTGNRLFVGSGTVNISSGANQLAMRLEKVAKLLSSEPKAGAQMLSSELLTLNFNAPPGVVTVNGTQARVQGQAATWTASGLAAGTTTLNIAWTAAGGGSYTLQLRIIVPPTEITPSKATLTAIGMTVQLSATVKDEKNQFVPDATVNWSSSNPSVVSVSPQGLVTARGNGTATIRATSGARSLTAVITVAQSATTIKITPANPPLITVGSTLKLGTAVRDPKNNLITGIRVNWSSSNPSVATVSSTGLVTALRDGQTTIRASAGGRLSDTVSITADRVPSIVAGTVKDGDSDVNIRQILHDGGFSFDFNEPIIGSIKLTDEGGRNLNWKANVSGQTAMLAAGTGRPIAGQTTYKIEIDVRSLANNRRTKQTITFVTGIKE